MKDTLIFGAGQVAEVFAEYLDLNHIKVRAFVVDADMLTQAIFCDRPVVAFEDLEKVYSPAAYQFLVGMSFRGINAIREAKFDAMRAKGYEPLTFVDRNARVAASARIGAGAVILDGNVIQSGVTVGDNVVMWSGNHIGHHSRIAAHCWISSHCVISGACVMYERCFVGVNATIRDGVKIGESCVIGAHAHISKDCAAHGVYPGAATERSPVPSYKLRGI